MLSFPSPGDLPNPGIEPGSPTLLVDALQSEPPGKSGKVMSLLFNMLSRLAIIFLPKNKRLLISRLQSQSAVILEPKNIKSPTVSVVSPSISHEVMGPDAFSVVQFHITEKSREAKTKG